MKPRHRDAELADFVFHLGPEGGGWQSWHTPCRSRPGMTAERPDEGRWDRVASELRTAEVSCGEEEPIPGDILFDPTPEFRADPYPVYARLRAQDPVHRTALGLWVLTRYDDVATALRDPRFSREGFETAFAGVDGTAREPGRPQPSMLYRDPPDHTRLRAAVSRAFTPRRVEALRPRIQRLVDELLDRVRDTGRMDVIADLAAPLPVAVIGEVLGVPPEDWTTLTPLSADVAESLDALPVPADRQLVERGRAARHELGAYFRHLVAARRCRPQDDLVSQLITAADQGYPLSEDELLGMTVLLAVAGHETTTHLVGNGVLALLRYPDQLARLREEPGLLPSAVEELLRYDAPVQRTWRITTAAVEFGGRTAPAGAPVMAVLGAANRDPARFPEPDRLDLARPDNAHLAFGAGVHHCLGVALARLEAAVAIGTLVRRMPRLQLATAQPEWRGSSLVRGLAALPVTF
jgi:cytochrome P450